MHESVYLHVDSPPAKKCKLDPEDTPDRSSESQQPQCSGGNHVPPDATPTCGTNQTGGSNPSTGKNISSTSQSYSGFSNSITPNLSVNNQQTLSNKQQTLPSGHQINQTGSTSTHQAVSNDPHQVVGGHHQPVDDNLDVSTPGSSINCC